MNKKNKTDATYANMFKLKKLENGEKPIIGDKKKGINFENITDWDDINYDGKKNVDFKNEKESSESIHAKRPYTDRNNLNKNNNENYRDKEYDFYQNKIAIEPESDIKNLNMNKHHPQGIQNMPNAKMNYNLFTEPVQENQNDNFSINTSNFTNKYADLPPNNIDKIELSQNNFPADYNGIHTNLSNKKILPFNSTDNLASNINNYKNNFGYNRNYEIIEEKTEEEGKIHPSDFQMEESINQNEQENNKYQIKNNIDSDSDNSDFSLNVNHELNVTSNQLEDMNRELKNINYNVKITDRKNKKQEINDNKSTKSAKVMLEPMNSKKKESKSSKNKINFEKENLQNTPDYKTYHSNNQITDVNSKPVSIQTYQNNTNIMNFQPNPYYNSHYNTTNPINYNNVHFDPNAGPIAIPLQMPFGNYGLNHIQPMYNQPNIYGNPYMQNYGMINNNIPYYNYAAADQNAYPININPHDFNQNNQNAYPSPVEADKNRENNNIIPKENKIQKQSTTYKPYTYGDYKIKYDGNNLKLGGLGANLGTKEWEEKHQKKKKMKEYSTNVNVGAIPIKEKAIHRLESTKEKALDKFEDECRLDSALQRNGRKDEPSPNDSLLNLEHRIFRDLKMANDMNDVITYSFSTSKEKDKKSGTSHVHNVIKLKEDKKFNSKSELDNKTKVRPKSSLKKEILVKPNDVKKDNGNIYTTIHKEKDSLSKIKKNKNEIIAQLSNAANDKSESFRKSRPTSTKVIINSKDDDPYVKNFYNTNNNKDEYNHLETLLQQHRVYNEKVQNIKTFMNKFN